IVLWSKQAELAQQYLKKGNQVYIEGRIQSRQWDDKEGQKRTTYEIVGTAMRFVWSRSEAVAAAAGAGQDSEAHASAAPDEAVAAPEISDEDIPLDRKSTRLNSSHGSISYAVFCLKKTKTKDNNITHTRTRRA